MSSPTSMLSTKQKYASGALFAMALHRAQIHQTLPLGISHNHSHLWVHQSSGLLRPIFKFLEIDTKAWTGLEKSAVENHRGDYLRALAEESDNKSPDAAEKESALTDGVEAVSSKLEISLAEYDSKKEKQKEYEHACKEKLTAPDSEAIQESKSKEKDTTDNPEQDTSVVEQEARQSIIESDVKPLEEAAMLSYQRKVTVLYELLSACLANIPEDSKNPTKRRKGYDARHRVALRLLASWFNVKWIKIEASETMVACSAMALLNEEEFEEEGKSPEGSWEKWKRGGIVGAAALTGGTLLAITGGLAAPAIAAGFGALAPTLGTIVPVIGASGFAAVASAAGSVAGSVAVAASFGAAGAGLTGSKVARRIGEVEEFEFKAIGDNHNQGRLAVEILVSGFVFEEEDFIKPWEGQHNNLERYALQWESEHLIALSTAIQDWLTSKLATETMKQGAMMTVLSTLMSALAWPTTLITLMDIIDSKWAIAIDRSDKVGKMLADVLLKELQGHRPVTLIGFSLGARVIFSCLQILAENEANAGLVERVVLLGAPLAIKDVNWEATRKVVAGRYVNVYSTSDWILGIAFRANLLTKGLAGIQPVDVPGIENVDVTEIIDGHSSYLWSTQQILEMLQLETYCPVFDHNIATPTP